MAITESQSPNIIKKKRTLVHSARKLYSKPKSDFVSICCIRKCGIQLYVVYRLAILIIKNLFLCKLVPKLLSKLKMLDISFDNYFKLG